uniref:LAGLIDADG homing endonuclease n=1 Tax=Salvator merianae TaxID=96440 RepID=A0A8D0BYT4_SALMN
MAKYSTVQLTCYASRNRNVQSLLKKKILTFMNTELTSFIKKQKYPPILKKADMNCDGKKYFHFYISHFLKKHKASSNICVDYFWDWLKCFPSRNQHISIIYRNNFL